MANDNEKNVFTSTKVEDNEVIKAIDIQYGFDSQIDNVSKALMMLIDTKKDFVIGGKVRPYAGKLSVVVDPIYGVSISDYQCFGNTATSNAIVFESPSDKKRIDILEVRGLVETFAKEQRAFNDLETDIKTYREVDTKKKLSCEFVVKQGTPGSETAPATDKGYVKLAEVIIDTNTVNITEDNIKNITADTPELNNEAWTNEKDKTYNNGYISDINKRFRKDHNQDGSHKQNVIGISQLRTEGENSVNGANLPTGIEVKVNNDDPKGISYPIAQNIKNLATKITELFTPYLELGRFNFNGEVSVSDLIQSPMGSKVLIKPLRIGAKGDGTAYLTVDDKKIFTINENGVITTFDGYKATGTNDLITKSVTDAIYIEIGKLKEAIADINTQLDYQTYSNNVLGRYTTIDDVEVATTENITLNGTQIIDGFSVVDGTKVLVKNQTNKIENGIYRASGTNWVRYSGYTTPESMKYKYFKPGSGNQKGKLFYTPNEKFEVGVDKIDFTEYAKIKTEQIDSNATAPFANNLNHGAKVDGELVATTDGTPIFHTRKTISFVDLGLGTTEGSATIIQLWEKLLENFGECLNIIIPVNASYHKSGYITDTSGNKILLLSGCLYITRITKKQKWGSFDGRYISGYGNDFSFIIDCNENGDYPKETKFNVYTTKNDTYLLTGYTKELKDNDNLNDFKKAGVYISRKSSNNIINNPTTNGAGKLIVDDYLNGGVYLRQMWYSGDNIFIRQKASQGDWREWIRIATTDKVVSNNYAIREGDSAETTYYKITNGAKEVNDPCHYCLIANNCEVFSIYSNGYYSSSSNRTIAIRSSTAGSQSKITLKKSGKDLYIALLSYCHLSFYKIFNCNDLKLTRLKTAEEIPTDATDIEIRNLATTNTVNNMFQYDPDTKTLNIVPIK